MVTAISFPVTEIEQLVAIRPKQRTTTRIFTGNEPLAFGGFRKGHDVNRVCTEIFVREPPTFGDNTPFTSFRGPMPPLPTGERIS